MIEQGFPDTLALPGRGNEELVNIISSNRQEPGWQVVCFCDPQVITDQDYIPEIALVPLKRMPFDALELWERLLARLPPEQGEGCEIPRMVGADRNSHETHTAH